MPGTGTSLVVQWLRLCTSNARVMGSVPGCGTKMPHAVWCDPLPPKKMPKQVLGSELSKWKDECMKEKEPSEKGDHLPSCFSSAHSSGGSDVSGCIR